MNALEIFIQSFVLLLVIIEPIGTAPIFLSLTQGKPKRTIRQLALKAALVAMGLMLAFGLVGEWLLRQLGISMEAFRIAGGLLLFTMAYNMLMSHPEPTKDYENGAPREQQDIAVFPIGIPLLAGPGCLAAVILLFSQHSGAWLNQGMIFLAILAVSIVAYLCLLGAWQLRRLFGETGTNLLSRVAGILLSALAIQFIADGIIALAA